MKVFRTTARLSCAALLAAAVAISPLAAQEPTRLRMTVLGGVGAGDGTVGAIKAWNDANPDIQVDLELQSDELPAFVVKEYATLKDSADISPADWNVIGEDIATNYDRYNGFVILHGTDTMAYTASSLSFMLEGLAKPVILTGSQIPMCEVRNDARDNLLTSLIIAGRARIPEVCIYFYGRLLRGNL